VLSDIAASVMRMGENIKLPPARNYMDFGSTSPVVGRAGSHQRVYVRHYVFLLDSIKLISGPSIDSAFGKFSPMPAAIRLWGFLKSPGVEASFCVDPAPHRIVHFYL